MDPTPNSAACLYPFLSLTVSAVGDVELCCSTTFKVGSLRTSTFEELWSGPVLQEVRKAMLAGQELASCKGCYQAEREGLFSKRIKFTQSRLRVHGESACRAAFELHEPVVRHLDISFSNVCNLSCAMCMSRYSSSWFTKDQQALQEGLDFRAFNEGPFEIQRLADERIDELIERFVPNLRTIIIKGGEPLVEKQCLMFLRKLSRSEQRPKDLVVCIQTNATRVTDEFLNAIEGLNLEIGVSMDGTGDVYRWIRGFEHERTVANIALLNRSPNVKQIALDLTASVFNTHHLPEFARFASALAKETPKLERCSFLAWARQDYLTPLLIPQDERRELASELANLDVSPGSNSGRTRKFFDGIAVLNELLQRPQAGERALEKFRRWTEFCNRMRGFEIQSVEPRLRL